MVDEKKNSQTDETSPLMFNVVYGCGLQVGLRCGSGTSASLPRGNRDGTVEMLRHALPRSMPTTRPICVFIGNPALGFRRQQRFSPGTWQSIRDQVHPGRTSIWIAEGIVMSHQLLSMGITCTPANDGNPPTDVGATANKFSRWVQQARHFYGSYRDRDEIAMPGYNDTRTGRGNAFGVWPKGRGRLCPNLASSHPHQDRVGDHHLVQRMAEGTYIGPSQAYRDRYLGLTAEWAGRFKSGEAIAYTPPAPSDPSPSEREAGRESIPTPPPTPVPTPGHAAIRVQTPALNLRSEPSTTGPLLGQDDCWQRLACHRPARQRQLVAGLLY